MVHPSFPLKNDPRIYHQIGRLYISKNFGRGMNMDPVIGNDITVNFSPDVYGRRRNLGFDPSLFAHSEIAVGPYLPFDVTFYPGASVKY